jgi:hypothetical protein
MNNKITFQISLNYIIFFFLIFIFGFFSLSTYVFFEYIKISDQLLALQSQVLNNNILILELQNDLFLAKSATPILTPAPNNTNTFFTENLNRDLLYYTIAFLSLILAFIVSYYTIGYVSCYFSNTFFYKTCAYFNAKLTGLSFLAATKSVDIPLETLYTDKISGYSIKLVHSINHATLEQGVYVKGPTWDSFMVFSQFIYHVQNDAYFKAPDIVLGATSSIPKEIIELTSNINF